MKSAACSMLQPFVSTPGAVQPPRYGLEGVAEGQRAIAPRLASGFVTRMTQRKFSCRRPPIPCPGRPRKGLSLRPRVQISHQAPSSSACLASLQSGAYFHGVASQPLENSQSDHHGDARGQKEHGVDH